MEIRMTLGGIHFLFTSDREIRVREEFAPFLDKLGAVPDLTVPFLWDWAESRTAVTPMLGKDLQQHYYAEDGLRFCQTWGGPKGYIASTVYTPDFCELKCYVNQAPFINPLNDLTTLIRYLPMREIFQHFGVIFFHAAQIEVNGKGVLFTAPSGTGKTTQAQLWKRYRGAELICNDRTLVRKAEKAEYVCGCECKSESENECKSERENECKSEIESKCESERSKNSEIECECWRTYGYPVDGSAPVRSDRVLLLGAVVLLEQAPVNEVLRLPVAKTAAHLVGQMVIDVWSADARTRAASLALELLQDVPVYLLKCTPDVAAVECLEKKLMEEGVIGNG